MSLYWLRLDVSALSCKYTNKMPNNKIPDFLKVARDIKRDASRVAAIESVKFFKESFRKGGFTDISFTAWKSTNNPLSGNKTMHKSGVLMGSIHKVTESESRVVVESNTAFSEIHNNGGYIVVTVQMKKFFWAKYYEFTGGIKRTKKGKVSQAKANRKVSAKAEFCKAMALMKVGTKIKIPQRQFMGESRAMMNIFEHLWQGKLDIRFKQHLNDK